MLYLRASSYPKIDVAVDGVRDRVEKGEVSGGGGGRKGSHQFELREHAWHKDGFRQTGRIRVQELPHLARKHTVSNGENFGAVGSKKGAFFCCCL